jgi:hypothetical protein
MDRYPDMRQVLTLTNPPIELLAEPPLAVELSQIASIITTIDRNQTNPRREEV